MHCTTCGRGARSQALHLSQIVVCKMESLPVRLKFEGRHQRPSLIELVSVFLYEECSRFARHVVVRNILVVVVVVACRRKSILQTGKLLHHGLPW